MITTRYSIAVDDEQIISLIGQLSDEKKLQVVNSLQRELESKGWNSHDEEADMKNVNMEDIWEKHTRRKEKLVGKWIVDDMDEEFNEMFQKATLN